MPSVFEETRLASMHLKNRVVRSATNEAKAEKNGAVTGLLLEYLVDLVRGQVGLLISGHAYVAEEGQAGRRQLGIYDNSLLPGLQHLTGVVHAEGGVIVAQLAHAGRWGIGTGKHAARGPMASGEGVAGRRVLAMTRADINAVVSAFAHAARRARTAGFDGVQIHSAHGYLLSQFLSPWFNQREDGYGGSLENRARLLLEVYDAVRGSVGADYPVLVKINAEDFVEGGLSAADSVQVCQMLAERGVDAIEMSGGTFNTGGLSFARTGDRLSAEAEGYYCGHARRYKEEIKVPLILVGGFLRLSTIQEVLQTGLADYVALSRPLICEPHLVKRWAEGDHVRAACVSCNQCFATNLSKEGLFCKVTQRRQKS
ncbi:MAG: NADH:flavin oxidoreductase [Desulfobulbaceae bacterium]|nr:NADH:flavin oxidoreductase [Desulfobulbaceae bacterium]